MKDVAAAQDFLVSKLRASLGSVSVEPFPLPVSLDGEVAVVYKFMAGRPVRVIGSAIVWSEILFEVVAVGPGSNIGSVVAAASLIDVALDKQGGTNVDGTVYTCLRQAVVSFPYQSESGTVKQHLGGIYRILVKGA